MSIKILLDNLTEEFWDSRCIHQSNNGWGPITFFYSECGKISIKGTGIRRATLRKEIWKRLKDRGWDYLRRMQQERSSLQCSLNRPVDIMCCHLFNHHEVGYLIENSERVN